MFGRLTQETILCLMVMDLCTAAPERFVRECPRTKAEWERESMAFQCQEPNYYHCMRDDNGHFLQMCTQRVWIKKDMCPEFNSKAGGIYLFECPLDPANCPQTIFWSNTAYLFPGCYLNSKTTTPTTSPPPPPTTSPPTTSPPPPPPTTTTPPTPKTTPPPTTTTTRSTSSPPPSPSPTTKAAMKNDNNSDLSIVLAIAVLVVSIGLIGVIVWKCIRRRRQGRTKQTENPPGETKDNLLNQQSEEQKNEAEDFKKMSSIKFSEEASIIKGRQCQENPQDEETCNLLNQQSQQQQKVVDSMKVSSEGISEEKSNAIERCQVYVPEGTGKTGGQFIGSTRILVLSLLPTSSGEITEINKEAQKMFGGQYFYCRTLNYFLKHKQEQQASVLLKDFDFKTSDVDAILRKLHDVVSVSNLAFVLTVPLKDFTSNREKIMSIITKDKDIFKHKHV